MKRKKVLVGMSGGVDSSVAAALLVEQGYDVTGVYVEAYNEPGCRTDEDKKDALKAALKIGIPFEVIDLREQYKETVVKYFLDEYKTGRTPNPDIVCNREIKFGLLYDWAIRPTQRRSHFDYLATGHYARICYREQSDLPFLQMARDDSKDQSYFLWQVDPGHLEKVLFPLGEMKKTEVRGYAKKIGLANADKPDSMGVCMIGELNVRQFLKEKLGVAPGDVIWKGKVVGRHEGIWLSTIGERGGWSWNSGAQTPKSPALYVVDKDLAKNEIVVGEREECQADTLIVDKLELRIDPNLLETMAQEHRLKLRMRNLGEIVGIAEALVGANKRSMIKLESKVFAPAPGQSVVLYDESGVVLGGAIIDRYCRQAE